MGAPLAPIEGLRPGPPLPGGAGAGRLAWKLEGGGGPGKKPGVLGVCRGGG